MSQNWRKIFQDILCVRHFLCSTFSPFSVYVKSRKQKNIMVCKIKKAKEYWGMQNQQNKTILRQTEITIYCTFSGTPTKLCSVWEYHLLPEILLRETSSPTLNVKHLNELFICSRFYEIQCFLIFQSEKQISFQISRAKTCFNF